MTFLELLQRWKQESLVGGSAPLTVSGQTNMLGRGVSWLQDTWRDIQNMPARNWRWMRAAAVKDVTVAGGMDYVPATDWSLTRFGRMKPENDNPSAWYRPTAFLASAPQSEWPVRWLPYDRFRQLFLIGQPTSGPPQYWTEGPDGTVYVAPPPDQTYSFRFDYHKSAQELSVDADVPEMPTKFHLMIVWGALNKYGSRLAAPEVLARSYDEYQRLETMLIHEQGETITLEQVPIG